MVRLLTSDGGHSSVVRVLEFKSEDPGFDPLMGQGQRQFFCPSKSTLAKDEINVPIALSSFRDKSTLVQTCLCLTPLRVYGMHPNLCAQ